MSTQWSGLEPEGVGHDHLLIWGQHRRGGERSHSPVTSGSWSDRLDPCHDDEPWFVVEIDDVFRRLMRQGLEHTVDIGKWFYLNHPKYSMWEVANKVMRTEGFVRLTIRGVCGLVEDQISVVECSNPRALQSRPKQTLGR